MVALRQPRDLPDSSVRFQLKDKQELGTCGLTRDGELYVNAQQHQSEERLQRFIERRYAYIKHYYRQVCQQDVSFSDFMISLDRFTRNQRIRAVRVREQTPAPQLFAMSFQPFDPATIQE